MTLPIGWAEAPLLDIVDLHDNRRIPLNASERASKPGDFPYYGANGQVGTVGGYLFEGRHILLAEDGGHFGEPERGVAYEVDGKFWVNNHAHIVSMCGDMPTEFLTRLLNTIDWLQYVSGTTRLKLTQGGMQRIHLPVPPLAEQRRIVAKLDTLTARLTRARAELDRVPALAERMRANIVRNELDSLIQSGGSIDSGELFTWASGRFLPKKAQNLGDVPVFGGNGINGFHDEPNVQFRTLVIGRVGAQCGNVHTTDGAAWITDNAIFARAVSDGVDLDLALHVFRNAALLQHAGGTGQPYVNQDVLNKVRFPRADIREQTASARRIVLAFARADRLEAEARKARALLDRLESAVLARAFRGELVPQDPNDEPASALLARIRAQRAAAPPAKRGRKAKVA